MSAGTTALKDFSDFDAAQLATLTAGISLTDLNVLIQSARESGKRLDAGVFRSLKKRLLERQCRGLLEFIEPRWTLDTVVGHEAAKARLREDAALLKRGALDSLPMGYLLCGPVGTGKSFLAQCVSGEIGVPCVMLKNFRSKYVGETEGNLERVLAVLRAMGPVVVVVDEADAALGSREQDGDSGTSSRVFAMIAAQMGDTQYRGRIIWMLLTARPDLLPIDLKRQGRAEVHIPLFYPTDETEIRQMFVILAKKLGSRVAPEDVPAIPQRGHLSGADIEGMVGRAWRTSLLAGADHITREALAEVVAQFMPSTQGLERELQETAAILECTDRQFLPPTFLKRPTAEGGARRTAGAAHRAQAAGERVVRRHLWHAQAGSTTRRSIPPSRNKSHKLDSFTSALADGMVSKQELGGQEQRLVAAMKTARARPERRAALEGHDRAGRADRVQRDAAAARAAGRARASRVWQVVRGRAGGSADIERRRAGARRAHGDWPSRARNPRPPAPAIVHSEFVFERAPFPSAHASTIVETRDGLVAAWFGGTEEKNPDVGIWVARREADVWSSPVEVANGVQPGGTRYPCWNPVLFQPTNGPLVLFYKVGPSPSEWWGLARTSPDAGRTWSDAIALPEEILGPIRAKPVEIVPGVMLAGSSTENHGWVVHMERFAGAWTADVIADPRAWETLRAAEHTDRVRRDSANTSRSLRNVASDSVSQPAGCHHTSAIG